jgi:Peptidase of plants and bacteria/F5/8 type C domain
MQRLSRFYFSIPILYVTASTAVAAEPNVSAGKLPVVASIETTLSTASRQIRQFAFDGDAATYFCSGKNPGTSDHFTLVFDEPVEVKSIAIVTGQPDGADALDAGTLETSFDGKTFQDRANFTAGMVHAIPGPRPIRAIRIKPAQQLGHPLAIRELTIDSVPGVAVFGYPVEFIIDVADAPEIKEWAEKVARVCEKSYPMINEELKSEGYKPPTTVTMALKNSYRGVAAAGGGRIVGSVKYFKDHPNDIGAMVHETTHIVQRYRSRNNPGWLVEGVSDYVRFFKYEPGKLGRIDPGRAHYNGSYRTTAAFLAYLTEKYDKQIVLKLNAMMREGKYTKDAFKQLTGKTENELDDEWRATLRR